MKIGFVGLPGSGKTTCFRVLTGHTGVDTHHGANLAVIPIPDPRLERIFHLLHPKKMTLADATFVDFEALHKGAAASGELALHKVAGEVDAFFLIIQCFGALDHQGEPLRPGADLETVMLEMALSDLRIIEKRLDHLAKGPKSDRTPHELELLNRCRQVLSQGGALRNLELNADDRKYLRGFTPLTLMPMLVVLNRGEGQEEEGAVAGARSAAQAAGLPHLEIHGALELEIAQLPPDEQAVFRQDYGLGEPAHDRLLRASFQILDLITFFTCNESEARAWTVRRGATAPEAAGKVHSDMQTGFIRAEVTPFEWLDKLGSMALCKERGFQRVEGKEYVVKDGDILHIRFSR